MFQFEIIYLGCKINKQINQSIKKTIIPGPQKILFKNKKNLLQGESREKSTLWCLQLSNDQIYRAGLFLIWKIQRHTQ